MSGRALAAACSRGLVEPLIARALPRLRFSTARLGSGSDVLGYDDGMSEDHDWGLRLSVVVPEQDVIAVEALLDAELPDSFLGHPVRFATTWDAVVRQRAEVASASALSLARAGVDATRPLTLLDHASSTGQAVLELTAGPVFRDDGGVLQRLRTALETPEDVRRWAIASAWQQVAEQLPFVGRTGERGDDLGSALIAARLTRITMHLTFLLERRRPPYAKWLGTAFRELPLAESVGRCLDGATGRGWRTAEASLVGALEVLAAAQGEQGLPALVPVTERFWDRPYRGLRPVAQAVQAAIADPVVRALPLVGTPDLWTDDVRILVDHGVRRRATAALLGLDG